MMRRLAAFVGVVACVLIAAWVFARRERSEVPTIVPAQSVPAVEADGSVLQLASPLAHERELVAGNAIAAEVDATTTSMRSERVVTRLSGTVIPAVGREKLRGTVVVRALDVLGEHWDAKCIADGAFAFESLPAAKYWLQVRSPANGHGDAMAWLRDDTRCEVRLIVPSVLTIHVRTKEQQPLEIMGLLAAATTEAPGEWLDAMHDSPTDTVGCGRFGFATKVSLGDRALGLGSLELDCQLPLFVSLLRYQRVLATQRVEAGATEVHFVLRSDDPLLQDGGIRLRLLDAATREPLAACFMMVEGPVGMMAGGNAGVCTAEHLQPGTYTLRSRSKGHASLETETRVLPGQTVDLGDFYLDEGRVISGRIVDAVRSRGAFDIRIDGCDANGGTSRSARPQLLVVRSKSDGSFRVEGLAPGFHRLEVLQTDAGKSALCVSVFDVREGSVENAQLHVQPAVPFIVDPAGRNGPEARIHILDARGVLVADRSLAEPSPVRMNLASGIYNLEAWQRASDTPTRSVIQISSDPVVIDMP